MAPLPMPLKSTLIPGYFCLKPAARTWAMLSPAWPMTLTLPSRCAAATTSFQAEPALLADGAEDEAGDAAPQADITRMRTRAAVGRIRAIICRRMIRARGGNLCVPAGWRAYTGGSHESSMVWDCRGRNLPAGCLWKLGGPGRLAQ